MRGESFFIFNIGCKVNRYEGQALREAWLRLGLLEAASPQEAGVIVVNSCAVTARAEADLRSALRRFRRLAPAARLLVTGCAAALPFAATLPGVDRIVAQKDKALLLRGPLLPVSAPAPDELGSGIPVPSMFPSEDFAGASSPHHLHKDQESDNFYPAFTLSSCDRSRAALKIQDGCSRGCAFCIVPQLRGPARSRPFTEALDEAGRLFEAGFRELVISGVNLRQYKDAIGDFWDFLARLDAALAPDWAGRARLRISSLDPSQLGDKALRVIGQSALLAPHLHLSLQSGCQTVLRRMGRAFCEPEELPAFFARLQDIWPRFALGADLLTAFPGETDAEFAEGLENIRALPLSYAHVFPFSRRPGTAAADMGGQVKAGVKKERAAILRALATEKKAAFLQKLLELPVLRVVFEEAKGQRRSGVCEYYADCIFDNAGVRPAARVLTLARPLALEGDKLIVACLEKDMRSLSIAEDKLIMDCLEKEGGTCA
ncbi:MAG: radical SAM protein [Desulfovibrio sp.]|nr:radical SAM protein [Desulfovibrio sp.]